MGVVLVRSLLPVCISVFQEVFSVNEQQIRAWITACTCCVLNLYSTNISLFVGQNNKQRTKSLN